RRVSETRGTATEARPDPSPGATSEPVFATLRSRRIGRFVRRALLDRALHIVRAVEVRFEVVLLAEGGRIGGHVRIASELILAALHRVGNGLVGGLRLL